MRFSACLFVYRGENYDNRRPKETVSTTSRISEVCF
jgi:hypothetical protein